MEPEDVTKALANNGFDSYVDAFKKGVEESIWFAEYSHVNRGRQGRE